MIYLKIRKKLFIDATWPDIQREICYVSDWRLIDSRKPLRHVSETLNNWERERERADYRTMAGNGRRWINIVPFVNSCLQKYQTTTAEIFDKKWLISGKHIIPYFDNQ